MLKNTTRTERLPKTKFGVKLKEKGITLYAAAKAAGVSATQISVWYYGMSRPVLSDKFIKLCEWLKTKGVTVTMRDFEPIESQQL